MPSPSQANFRYRPYASAPGLGPEAQNDFRVGYLYVPYLEFRLVGLKSLTAGVVFRTMPAGMARGLLGS